MHEKTISILEKLIAVCQGGAKGLDLAASKVNSSLIQALFRGYSLQRSRFSGELEAAASALGRKAPAKDVKGGDAGESRWTKEMHAAGEGGEKAILSERESGEEAALAAYATALEEPELPAQFRRLISLQATEVKSALKEIHDLRNRFVSEK